LKLAPMMSLYRSAAFIHGSINCSTKIRKLVVKEAPSENDLPSGLFSAIIYRCMLDKDKKISKDNLQKRF
jgi:hypothetical protein